MPWEKYRSIFCLNKSLFDYKTCIIPKSCFDVNKLPAGFGTLQYCSCSEDSPLEMWFEKIAGLVIGQIAEAILLAVVLWLLWVRLRREQHLAFWSASWAVAALYIVSLTLYVVAYQHGSGRPLWVSLSLAGATLGWLQPALLFLSAGSLQSGRVSRRTVVLVTGIALALGIVWSVAAWAHGGWIASGEPFQRLQVVVAPRTFAEAAGMACYAVCFRRYYARARGFSGWLTVGFCLGYSIHLLLVSLGDIGLQFYGNPNGLLNSTIASIVPMGITLGIAISVMEQAEHSEGAVRSIWNSPLPMRLTDADGRVVNVNPAFCALVGRPPEEIAGRLFTECHAPSLERHLLERYRQEFAARSVEPRERRSFLRADGKLVETELTNTFVQGPAGVEVLTLVQDTTREHETAGALRRSEEHLQLLLDSATDAIFDFRMDGSSTERYTRFRDLLGYSNGELPETLDTWLNLMHPDDRATLAADLSHLRQAPGTLNQWEYRWRHKDGRWVWLRSTVRIMEREAGGQPRRVIGTLTDITDYKAAQEQTRRLETELLQTGKMEALGRLAGGVAHDFNNYLTVINGYCDLILNQITTGKQSERLRKIRAAGEKAAALTQQLLAVSRKHAVQPQPVGLNRLISEFAALIHRLIGENIAIVTHLDPDAGLVQADPGQIHQILMNLTLNARDAMPGGGEILIQTSQWDDAALAGRRPRHASPGSYVLLSVSDKGQGMSPDTMQHIFEPFFTTKAKGSGTGLGLATVSSIVQQAAGWVEAESIPGTGSTFRVFLPVIENASDSTAESADSRELPGGRETILLVEDQEELRRIAAEVLEERGYRVIEANGAEQALDKSSEYRGTIHLLLTDVVMPGTSGPELARRLGAARPETRVLFISGYAPNRLADLGPGARLLAKPFSPAELCAAVREVLETEQRTAMTVNQQLPPRW